jgi:hypothetical protein
MATFQKIVNGKIKNIHLIPGIDNAKNNCKHWKESGKKK